MDLIEALRIKAGRASVKTNVCPTWDEFVHNVRRTIGRPLFSYIYRGQINYEWSLQSRWERTFDSMRGHNSSRSIHSFAPEHVKFDAPDVELFKHYAERLDGVALPDDDDDHGWLLLAQHHGLKTRVLDWTRSPYVAAFFAFAEARTRASDQSAALFSMHQQTADEGDVLPVAVAI